MEEPHYDPSLMGYVCGSNEEEMISVLLTNVSRVFPGLVPRTFIQQKQSTLELVWIWGQY